MFKIGDFSKLTMVSIRMLRYYDDVGLVKPARLDTFTGYRYYSATQIEKVNLIIALRNMGFNVTEIAKAINSESDEFKAMLNNKKAEVETKISEEMQRLKRINNAIENLKKEKLNMSYHVTVKSIPSYKVASLRGIIASYSEEGLLWHKLGAYVNSKKIKTSNLMFTVYHDTEYKDKDVDVEVFMGVEELSANENEIVFKETDPVKQIASVLISGDYKNMSQAFSYLGKWIEENGYTISGNARQIPIKGPWNEENPNDYLTEVQIPITNIKPV